MKTFNPTENIDLVKVAEEQAEWRKLLNSRATLNRREYFKARGAELEQHHQATGNKDALAESLAMQGKFEEAKKTAKRKDLKKLFGEKLNAVTQPDTDCDCDNFRTENGARLPNQFIESYGWSEVHHQQMPFIRCQVCGNLNAKPMPEYLNAEVMKQPDFFRAK